MVVATAVVAESTAAVAVAAAAAAAAAAAEPNPPPSVAQASVGIVSWGRRRTHLSRGPLEGTRYPRCRLLSLGRPDSPCWRGSEARTWSRKRGQGILWETAWKQSASGKLATGTRLEPGRLQPGRHLSNDPFNLALGVSSL